MTTPSVTTPSLSTSTSTSTSVPMTAAEMYVHTAAAYAKAKVTCSQTVLTAVNLLFQERNKGKDVAIVSHLRLTSEDRDQLIRLGYELVFDGDPRSSSELYAIRLVQQTPP